MDAVWSFWSVPFAGKYGSEWAGTREFLLSWVLSYEVAARHYRHTRLCTDDDGARLLVDALGLEFVAVDTSLNCLKLSNPHWWAIGKLYAYKAQKVPFVHVDYDAFLWRPLSEEVASASVFGQNPEHFELGKSWYHPEKYQVVSGLGGWVPQEVSEYDSAGNWRYAVCCGIFGGNDLEFIGHYATTAIRVVECEPNCRIWRLIGEDNILVEQYLLSALIEKRVQASLESGAQFRASYLFGSSEEAFDGEHAREVGFTHLIGGAKSNRLLSSHLEDRVRVEYPDRYERVLALSNR